MAGRRSATRRAEGVVRGLGHDGSGAVPTDQGVVFVPGALPGERVRFSVAGKRRGVHRGRLLEVLEASPERVEPPCPLAGDCGGCPLMILDEDAQRRSKAEAASRATGTPTPVSDVGPSLGYRQRARLGYSVSRGRRRLGYRAHEGRNVIDVDTCPVLTRELGEALTKVRASVLPELVGRGEVQLAMGAGAPVVWVKSDEAQPREVYDRLGELVGTPATRPGGKGALAGAVLSIEDLAPARWGDPREQHLGIDDEPIFGAPFGFSQANGLVNRALAAQVVQWAAPAGMRVVELYSGHGNLSVGLARGAKSFLCVEESEEAAALCRENLRARGLEGRVLAADAAAGAAKHRGPADVVVLDPPRTGARDALGAIIALSPARIIYVSCDPPTLGRDLGGLREAGYAVAETVAYDMFPHTAHLEVVAYLTRDSAPKNG